MAKFHAGQSERFKERSDAHWHRNILPFCLSDQHDWESGAFPTYPNKGSGEDRRTAANQRRLFPWLRCGSKAVFALERPHPLFPGIDGVCRNRASQIGWRNEVFLLEKVSYTKSETEATSSSFIDRKKAIYKIQTPQI